VKGDDDVNYYASFEFLIAGLCLGCSLVCYLKGWSFSATVALLCGALAVSLGMDILQTFKRLEKVRKEHEDGKSKQQ
jgi:hypothetical protein